MIAACQFTSGIVRPNFSSLLFHVKAQYDTDFYSSRSLLALLLQKLPALISHSLMAVMHSSVIIFEVTQCVNIVCKQTVFGTYRAAHRASSCGNLLHFLLTNRCYKTKRMQESVLVQFFYSYLFWHSVLFLHVIIHRAYCQSSMSSEECQYAVCWEGTIFSWVPLRRLAFSLCAAALDVLDQKPQPCCSYGGFLMVS